MFKQKPPFIKFNVYISIEYKTVNIRHYKHVFFLRLGNPEGQDLKPYFNAFSHLSKTKVVKCINLINYDMNEMKRLRLALNLIKFQGKNLKGGDFVLESNNERVMDKTHTFKYFFKQACIVYSTQYYKDMEAMKNLTSVILIDENHISPFHSHRFKKLQRVYIKVPSLDPKHAELILSKFSKQHVNIMIATCSAEELSAYSPLYDLITSVGFPILSPDCTISAFQLLPGLRSLQHLYTNINPGDHKFKKKEDFGFLKNLQTLDRLEDLEFCMNNESFTVPQHQDFWKNFKPPANLKRLEMVLTGDVFHPLLVEKSQDANIAKEEIISHFRCLKKLKQFELVAGGVRNIERSINKFFVELLSASENVEHILIKLSKGLNSACANIEFPLIYDSLRLANLKSISLNLSEIGPSIDILPTSFPDAYRINLHQNLIELRIKAKKATNYKSLLNLLDALPEQMRFLLMKVEEKIELQFWESFIEKTMRFKHLEYLSLANNKLQVTGTPRLEEVLTHLIISSKYLAKLIVEIKLGQTYDSGNHNLFKDAILDSKSLKCVDIDLGYLVMNGSFMHRGIFKPLFVEDEFEF